MRNTEQESPSTRLRLWLRPGGREPGSLRKTPGGNLRERFGVRLNFSEGATRGKGGGPCRVSTVLETSPELLTLPQVAKLCGVSQRTVWGWANPAFPHPR